jgi:hypothetical protein
MNISTIKELKIDGGRKLYEKKQNNARKQILKPMTELVWKI